MNDTNNQAYFHSLHQLPELGLRVGETRNGAGGRVWADTGEPSVPLVSGCIYCKAAYGLPVRPEPTRGDGTTSISLGLEQSLLDAEQERSRG